MYIHRCVKPARLFVNRILQVLLNAPAKGYFALHMGFYKDINWFICFLEKFNGMVNFYSHEKVTNEIFVDASLHAVGAKYNKEIYTCEIPDALKI